MTRREALWELPLIEGLRQVHIHRLRITGRAVWPESREEALERIRARIRAGFEQGASV